MTMCKPVQEKLVAGEPLGDAERDHLDGCRECRGLGETAGRLTPALALARPVADPALVARLIAGAEARLERRPAWVGAAFGVVVVAAMVLVGLGLRAPEPASRPGALPTPGLVDIPAEIRVAGRDLEERLLLLSDTETSRRLSARWSVIESPLAGVAWLAEGARAPLVPVEKNP